MIDDGHAGVRNALKADGTFATISTDLGGLRIGRRRESRQPAPAVIAEIRPRPEEWHRRVDETPGSERQPRAGGETGQMV